MDESAIFEAALQKTAGEDRAAFLAEACGADKALHDRLAALIAAHENPDSFLVNPAKRAFGASDVDVTVLHELERDGKNVGPYKLLQQIGEGGMGVVFMAEQTEPVRRRVALKIIKPGMDSREVIARFEAERQALAMMDHPNIARVLDAGTTPQGRPFFVMELVNGLPITEFCDEHNLSTKQRLELFAAVCRGVQHAHQKAVIHRDLKPSNILVAEYDRDAIPKVIDFGVAKATNQQLTEKTLFTQLGQVVGTLEYMSPEQAKRNQLDVDTRSDVYSLGIVLYELLTGETPIDKQRLHSAAFDEMLRIIREEDPPLPSRKLSESKEINAVAAKRKVDPGRLSALVRGDLDWIVLKSLQKDRSQRYSTAIELADDITRHLSDQPILAGPPRLVTRIRKFAKRNSWPLLVSATIVAVVLSAGVWFAIASQASARVTAARAQRTSEAIETASLALGQAIKSPVHSDAEWLTAEASINRVGDFLIQGELPSDVKNRANELLARADEARTERDIAVRLENVLITSASHPDRQSWQRMEQELRQIFSDHGFDLDQEDPMVIAQKIRQHKFALRFTDILELWIATRAQIGGEEGSQESLAPWAECIYAADVDPLRTGIRQLIYAAKPVTKEQMQALVKDVDFESLSPRTLSWLSSVYWMAQMPDEANDIIVAALHRHPSDVMLNFDRGYSLAHQQRWQEALRMYSRAIALRPDAAGIWQMMGIALEKVDELENAREAFERACELEDDYGPTWVNLGNVLLKLERADEAQTAGQRAIELTPDHPSGYGVVGRALMQQEKYQEALPILEKCDEVRVNDRRWQKPSKQWIAECKRHLSEDEQ